MRYRNSGYDNTKSTINSTTITTLPLLKIVDDSVVIISTYNKS